MAAQSSHSDQDVLMASELTLFDMLDVNEVEMDLHRMHSYIACYILIANTIIMA